MPTFGELDLSTRHDIKILTHFFYDRNKIVLIKITRLNKPILIDQPCRAGRQPALSLPSDPAEISANSFEADPVPMDIGMGPKKLIYEFRRVLLKHLPFSISNKFEYIIKI